MRTDFYMPGSDPDNQKYIHKVKKLVHEHVEKKYASVLHINVMHALDCIGRISTSKPLPCDCEADVKITVCPRHDDMP